MTDPMADAALHELVNSLGALLLELQLTTEQRPAAVTARQLDRWTELATAAAERAHVLRDHLR